jgi:hypothetical protein
MLPFTVSLLATQAIASNKPPMQRTVHVTLLANQRMRRSVNKRVIIAYIKIKKKHKNEQNYKTTPITTYTNTHIDTQPALDHIIQ